MDRQIVEAARAGDRPAFDALMRREVHRVYRLALVITGNEADASDATQDTFLQAWRSFAGLRDANTFDAWLTRITVNASRMVLRSRRRRLVREIAVADVDPGAPRPTFAASSVEDGLALRAALARLPAEQRALLALRHLEGRGIPEMAAILDVPDGTVKSRLFNARRALEQALALESVDG